MMLLTSVKTTNVGMGEMVISKDPSDVLACIGLGSCIAMCIWDPVAKLGGVAHMLLPTSRSSTEIMGSPAKYITNGVPNLINKMVKNGASKHNLIVKVTGGARMLNIPGENNILDIGQRNILEVRAVMKRENIPILAEDVGGTYGRSIQLFMENGKIMVKSLGGRIIEL
jgi:chemotaxis protein CheD